MARGLKPRRRSSWISGCPGWTAGRRAAPAQGRSRDAARSRSSPCPPTRSRRTRSARRSVGCDVYLRKPSPPERTAGGHSRCGHNSDRAEAPRRARGPRRWAVRYSSRERRRPSLLSAEDRILEGLSAAQRDAVLHGDGAAAHHRRRGHGQDDGAHAAHRAPDREQARARRRRSSPSPSPRRRRRRWRSASISSSPTATRRRAIGTFHAFGDRVLREAALEAGMNPEFRVLSRPEQIIFLRERIFQLPLHRFRPLGDPTRHLGALLSLVSRAKDEDVSPEAYRAWAEEQAAARATDEERGRGGSASSSWPRSTSATSGCWPRPGSSTSATRSTARSRVLRERPALLARLRERYRYVLVDEFQDTNHAQLELVRLLLRPSRRTSPWSATTTRRSIAGAAPRPRTCSPSASSYPGCREVVLVDNHRSTQVILDASARLISYNNPYRLEVVAGIDKRLRSPRATAAGGAPSLTSTPCPPRPTAWPRSSTRSCRRAIGRATWPCSCAATTTPIRSCAR